MPAEEFDYDRPCIDWGHCYFLWLDGHTTDAHEYALYVTEDGGLCLLEDPEMDPDGQRLYYRREIGGELSKRDLMRWWLDFTGRRFYRSIDF